MARSLLIFDNDIGFQGQTAVIAATAFRSLDPRVTVEMAESRNNSFPPSVRGYAGLILTGSSASAYQKDVWIARLKEAVLEAGARDIPVLGFCFGAHVLALAYGAQVEPSGSFEVGWKDINLNLANPLFRDFPAVIRQYEIHKDMITVLSSGLEQIAWNEFGVQGFQVKEQPSYGLQFHPEVDYHFGKHVLEVRKNQLDLFGISLDDCLSSYSPNLDYSTAIFRRFLSRAFEK